MRFASPLIAGKLVRRYKRFLADVELADGTIVTAHCPNPGSMRGCQEPGWDTRLSFHDDPRRKLKYTWQLVHNGVCWIVVNTQLANAIVHEAVLAGRLPPLTGYTQFRREVRYDTNSRIDLLATADDGRRCFVEVKSVTMRDDTGCYAFPDSVTERGRKHLAALVQVVAGGDRAIMLFAVQRSDSDGFRPAADIDPAYAAALREAVAAGVECFAFLATVEPDGVELTDTSVSIRLD